MYIPSIKLTKFEPLEPSRSGDISLLVSTFEGSCGAAILFGRKFDFHPRNTHTSCIYFVIKFSGITPVYPNVILRS